MSTVPDYTSDQLRTVVKVCGEKLIETFMAHRELLRTPCVECVNFDEITECCTLAKPPARPPARTMAYGCKYFDHIPF
jgi:hypothetical protein